MNNLHQIIPRLKLALPTVKCPHCKEGPFEGRDDWPDQYHPYYYMCDNCQWTEHDITIWKKCEPWSFWSIAEYELHSKKNSFLTVPDFTELFVTFTCKPGIPKYVIVKNVYNMMKRGALKISRFKVVPEHIETNFHLHCYVKIDQADVKPSKFLNRLENYRKYGIIDVRNVSDKAGLDYYMSKENEAITTLEGIKELMSEMKTKN